MPRVRSDQLESTTWSAYNRARSHDKSLQRSLFGFEDDRKSNEPHIAKVEVKAPSASHFCFEYTVGAMEHNDTGD